MSQRYKKALVTGGAGFIGSHIAKRLKALGLEVAIIDDLSMGSFVPTERDSIFVGPLESLVHAESLECPEKGFQ